MSLYLFVLVYLCYVSLFTLCWFIYAMLVYLCYVGLFMLCWFIYAILVYLRYVGLFMLCWFVNAMHKLQYVITNQKSLLLCLDEDLQPVGNSLQPCCTP